MELSDGVVKVPKIHDGVKIDNTLIGDVMRQRVETYPSNSFGELTADAWGIQKMSLPYSIFHGMWTYDISPNQFFMYENGTQVYTSTNITSSNSAALLSADSTKSTLVMESRECPRYQPNRGHLFSTALWCPGKTLDGVREWGLKTTENGVYFRLKSDGNLYAVRRSGNSEIVEELIDTSVVSGFDVQKGNVYDIQYQWRGIGNYKFFINLQLVHTFSNLGTLTALSMQNPALPVYFGCQRVTQDVTMYAGCVDITSENGISDSQEYGMAYAGSVNTNGTDKPVLCIYNPLQINGVTNTRTINIASITVNNNKKSVFRLWRTRTASDITGATFKEIGSGSYIQSDSTNMNATAVRATAVTTANMKLQSVFPVEAATARIVDTPNMNIIQFNMVRGDYLVLTSNASTGVSEAVIKWGEEI